MEKKMKKRITITATILMLICFTTVSAYADRKTMEGFMIGTGVAILGTAILHGINKDSKPQYSKNYNRYDSRHYAYQKSYNTRHHRKIRPYRSSGHWEMERIWIEPSYEKKWNPAHYNKRGEWISGRYEKFLINDGYWQEDKIWVHH